MGCVPNQNENQIKPPVLSSTVDDPNPKELIIHPPDRQTPTVILSIKSITNLNVPIGLLQINVQPTPYQIVTINSQENIDLLLQVISKQFNIPSLQKIKINANKVPSASFRQIALMTPFDKIKHHVGFQWLALSRMMQACDCYSKQLFTHINKHIQNITLTGQSSRSRIDIQSIGKGVLCDGLIILPLKSWLAQKRIDKLLKEKNIMSLKLLSSGGCRIAFPCSVQIQQKGPDCLTNQLQNIDIFLQALLRSGLYINETCLNNLFNLEFNQSKLTVLKQIAKSPQISVNKIVSSVICPVVEPYKLAMKAISRIGYSPSVQLRTQMLQDKYSSIFKNGKKTFTKSAKIQRNYNISKLKFQLLQELGKQLVEGHQFQVWGLKIKFHDKTLEDWTNSLTGLGRSADFCQIALQPFLFKYYHTKKKQDQVRLDHIFKNSYAVTLQQAITYYSFKGLFGEEEKSQFNISMALIILRSTTPSRRSRDLPNDVWQAVLLFKLRILASISKDTKQLIQRQLLQFCQQDLKLIPFRFQLGGKIFQKGKTESEIFNLLWSISPLKQQSQIILKTDSILFIEEDMKKSGDAQSIYTISSDLRRGRTLKQYEYLRKNLKSNLPSGALHFWGTHHQFNSKSPILFPPLKNFPILSVSCGLKHVAAINIYRHLFLWGNNQKGQCGRPQSLYQPPYKFQIKKLVFSIHCGYQTTFFTDTDGLYGIGNKYLLGSVETHEGGHIPHKVQIQNAIIEVACGGLHTLAVTESGVYGWGQSKCGQVTRFQQLVRLPEKIKFQQQSQDIHKYVKTIRAGQAHSLCLMNNGKVYSWGFGQQGQLGFKINQEGFKKIDKPTLIPFHKRFIEIQAGSTFSLFFSEDKKLYACGSNDNYQANYQIPTQIFSEKKIQRSDLFQLKQIRGLQNMNIYLIRAGLQHTHISVELEGKFQNKKEKMTFAWGANESFQLGITEQSKRSLKRNIGGLTGKQICDMRLGQSFSYAILGSRQECDVSNFYKLREKIIEETRSLRQS